MKFKALWRYMASAFLLSMLSLAGTGTVFAQSETTLYSFQPFGDLDYPQAALIADNTGALYGTATQSGVFKLTPPATQGGVWTESILYSHNGDDPYASLLFYKGNLYGTTAAGGAYGFGSVFELSPPVQQGGAWTETNLHDFTGKADGEQPLAGLVADKQGRLYGTTEWGGHYYVGLVFRLSPPSQPGGVWNEQVLYSFKGGTDGANPISNLIFDDSGSLYGTTYRTGNPLGGGTVFKLSPPASGNGNWDESVLYAFSGGSDGNEPEAGVAFDKAGALYGTTTSGGGFNNPWCYYGCGTVFKLTPPAGAGGNWTESVLYAFTDVADGLNPVGGVVFGPDGSLYGTTESGGPGRAGTVFKLAPPSSGDGPWSKSFLFGFGGPHAVQGTYPQSTLLLLGNKLYGTTQFGGSGNTGAVFEVIP